MTLRQWVIESRRLEETCPCPRGSIGRRTCRFLKSRVPRLHRCKNVKARTGVLVTHAVGKMHWRVDVTVGVQKIRLAERHECFFYIPAVLLAWQCAVNQTQSVLFTPPVQL